jgi:hypothetical protein
VDLGTLLSTIVLVSFIVTIILAVGSYMAYKFRERRRPRDTPRGGDAPQFFERFQLPSSAAPAPGDTEMLSRSEPRP